MAEARIPQPGRLIIDPKTGYISRDWWRFFHDLWQRSGGGGDISGLTTADIGTVVQADLDVPSQAEAEAGTAATERVWTAERVKQAIAALETGGDVVDDTSPQLGGNLDVNGNIIVSTSNGDIVITPNGTGDVVLDGQKWPQADGSANQFLKTDGAAQLSWGAGGSGPTLGTEQSASGTSVDFTSIPAGTKRIIVQFVGVSQDSSNQDIIVQLGDSGGIETTGYLGSRARIAPSTTSSALITAGLAAIGLTGAAAVLHGNVTLTLEDSTNFTWTSTSTIAFSNSRGVGWGAGSKSLSAELTQLRITTVGGSAQFDAGSFNILYE